MSLKKWNTRLFLAILSQNLALIFLSKRKYLQITSLLKNAKKNQRINPELAIFQPKF